MVESICTPTTVTSLHDKPLAGQPAPRQARKKPVPQCCLLLPPVVVRASRLHREYRKLLRRAEDRAPCSSHRSCYRTAEWHKKRSVTIVSFTKSMILSVPFECTASAQAARPADRNWADDSERMASASPLRHVAPGATIRPSCFHGELAMNAPSPVRSPGTPPSLMTA